MMTIPKALSSGQAQTYHKLEYTSAAQSYYKQGDEVKGEWQGRLATSLGLSGEVAAQEFSRLSEGQHPQTEAQMVRHRASRGVSKCKWQDGKSRGSIAPVGMLRFPHRSPFH